MSSDRIVLGYAQTRASILAKRRVSTAAPTGRMRVMLGLHGGEQALADVMTGLVEWNAEMIRRGNVPPLSQVRNRIRYEEDHVWRDALSSLREGKGSSGTLAAWKTAELKVQGTDAHIGISAGLPVVVRLQPDGRVGDIEDVAGCGSACTPGIVGALGPSTGVVREYMVLSIDDQATPVGVMGNAIRDHNAKQVARGEVPPLYESGVVYRAEGAPERWWDAKEIVANGFDDCEGLAAYRAGELTAWGIPASVVPRKIEKPNTSAFGGSGKGRLFHAVTRLDDRKAPDGTPIFDDPSARLGMEVPTWYRDHARRRRALGQDL